MWKAKIERLKPPGSKYTKQIYITYNISNELHHPTVKLLAANETKFSIRIIHTYACIHTSDEGKNHPRRSVSSSSFRLRLKAETICLQGQPVSTCASVIYCTRVIYERFNLTARFINKRRVFFPQYVRTLFSVFSYVRVYVYLHTFNTFRMHKHTRLPGIAARRRAQRK